MLNSYFFIFKKLGNVVFGCSHDIGIISVTVTLFQIRNDLLFFLCANSKLCISKHLRISVFCLPFQLAIIRKGRIQQGTIFCMRIFGFP